MSKGTPTGLELVKDLKSFAFRFNQKSAVDCLYVSGALNQIEKELKALDIIEKITDKNDLFEDFGSFYFLGIEISEDDFNFLKEVLWQGD